MKKRNVAYKVWISQLVNNKYVKQEGEFESSYVEANGKNISRVNIIATVVSKFYSDDSGYSSITIDDGSSEIRLKAWGDESKAFLNINAGDVILVVAKVREYNNEIYLTPELVKTIKDLNWEIARKFELLKEYGFVKKLETISYDMQSTMQETKKEYTEERIEDSISNSQRQVVLDMINKLATSDGISINEISRQSELSLEEVNIIINDLVKDGEIYKSKAGVVNLV